MIYLSIIIPCYNEERRLGKNLDIKLNYLKNQKYNWEMILVNDGSVDKTEEIMRDYIARYKKFNIKLVNVKPNKGKGNAIRKGMLAACGKYRLFTDSDDSTKIQEIEKMLAHIKKYDIVIASRYIKGSKIKTKQSPFRILVSRAGNLYIRLFLGLNYKDTQCGFKLFSARAAKEIFSRSLIKRWGFDIEVLVLAQKLDFRIKEVPVTWQDMADSKLRPLKAASQVFSEVIKIKQNLKKNRYRLI